VQISRLTTRRIFSASSTGIRPQKETLAMTASDRFTDLREQVERAEREVRAAAAETRAAVDARLDDARRRADDLTAGMRERAREDADQADAHWQALHRSWDEHVQRVRRRIDEHDTAVDLAWAQRDAPSPRQMRSMRPHSPRRRSGRPSTRSSTRCVPGARPTPSLPPPHHPQPGDTDYPPLAIMPASPAQANRPKQTRR
jgi:hypothetical protein